MGSEPHCSEELFVDYMLSDFIFSGELESTYGFLHLKVYFSWLEPVHSLNWRFVNLASPVFAGAWSR